VELLGESGRAVTGQVRQAGWSSGEYQQDCQDRAVDLRTVTDRPGHVGGGEPVSLIVVMALSTATGNPLASRMIRCRQGA
jgi:hypothetical protein